ncbi:MAG TPA: hypothetical protein VHB25_20265 [Gemmatimonadaceae bacterium]|nr:hypothetical protein [Gemmatimonadaceae bacterium]
MTNPSPSWESTSVAAVLARRSHEDVTELVGELATLLGGIVPGAQVERTLLRRRIDAVRLPIGDEVYVLRRERGTFQASRQHAVRGVVIRTDPLELDAFLAELGAAVDAEVARNERMRSALRTWIDSMNL